MKKIKKKWRINEEWWRSRKVKNEGNNEKTKDKMKYEEEMKNKNKKEKSKITNEENIKKLLKWKMI